jgi:drug/metabolite transporter (DMT)-like permease
LSKKLIGYLFIAIAACLWGSFSVVAKVFFNEAYFDPLQITQLRTFSSGAALFLIILIVNRKALKIDIKSFGTYLLLGFTILHVQLSLYVAISLTDVSIASFLQYLAPAMIFAYSVAFHHEAIKLRELLILTLAITGMIFLIVSSIQHDLSMLGVITGLWTAVALSIYTIYSKGVVKKYNPWTALAYGLLSISLLSFLFSPPSPEIFDGFPYSIPLFLFYVCFFSMIIPYGLWLLGLRFVKPHQASITSTLEPVSAILLSGLLLLESITATKLIGCLLIISSVCLLAYQNLHNDKPQKDELQ